MAPALYSPLLWLYTNFNPAASTLKDIELGFGNFARKKKQCNDILHLSTRFLYIFLLTNKDMLL